MSQEVHDQLIEYILDANVPLAVAIIEDWIEQYGSEKTFNELIDPIMSRAGAMWENDRGEINLAQGYIAAKIIEMAMSNVVAPAGLAEAVKGPIVVGNVEDDFHQLGKNMVISFLQMSGWKVIDLGVDVPAEEFVDQAVESGSRVIGVSAMTYTNALNIEAIRSEIDRRGLTGRIKLAVGGAVFTTRPELSDQLGADGMAVNCIKTPMLFEQLWADAEELASTY